MLYPQGPVAMLYLRSGPELKDEVVEPEMIGLKGVSLRSQGPIPPNGQHLRYSVSRLASTGIEPNTLCSKDEHVAV